MFTNGRNASQTIQGEERDTWIFDVHTSVYQHTQGNDMREKKRLQTLYPVHKIKTLQ